MSLGYFECLVWIPLFFFKLRSRIHFQLLKKVLYWCEKKIRCLFCRMLLCFIASPFDNSCRLLAKNCPMLCTNMMPPAESLLDSPKRSLLQEKVHILSLCHYCKGVMVRRINFQRLLHTLLQEGFSLIGNFSSWQLLLHSSPKLDWLPPRLLLPLSQLQW